MKEKKIKEIIKKIDILKKKVRLISNSQKNSFEKNILKKVATSLRKVIVFLEKND